ncbi:ribonuclease HIII [Synoicihabitans lomoniglobus]|uniref:Ribonuclease n=1 Tax=Synoicihabitans lomoniglobus TaxID=2909285 RepID=A0AAF0CML3_9BACT|nr:ribonuclease HIII [Opitutaceae bacterium LMO-M01]WED63200.1 ribonuclease HIII [Opitutaceae bacterium LMO-M01]
MPKKKPSADPDAPKKLSTYTVKLDDAQMTKLEDWCAGRGWPRTEVAYARFAFKGTNVNVTGYESRKVLIAGKGTEDFVTMTLEPEITGEAKLGYDEVLNPDWFEPHAGLDESGKGDFFGPVVAATVVASKPAIEALIKAGVKDSKKIADSQILRLDQIIRNMRGVTAELCYCGMPKYNELMSRPRANLNRLLAWQHSLALLKALEKQPVPRGLLDQFSKTPLVQNELTRKGLKNFTLDMRTKAESDPVVAAASIVARAEYVRILKKLSDRFGKPLQKGASAMVKAQALEIMEKFGAKALGDFAKLHFRTAYEVVKDAGKLDELPLPEPKDRFER